MSTNLTYDTLVEDLSGYLDRGSLDGDRVQAAIPRRINDAERGIIADLKIQGYEHTLRGYLTAGNALMAKPERWRQTLSMHIAIGAKRQPIFLRGYEYLRGFWPDETLTAAPTFYGDMSDKQWVFAATPDDAYPIESRVYLMPRLLGPEQQTNVFSEVLPNALRNRALKEMCLYLKKYDLVGVFDAEYKAALGALGTEDNKKMMDRAAERDGA